jgi:hypothetical protein
VQAEGGCEWHITPASLLPQLFSGTPVVERSFKAGQTRAVPGRLLFFLNEGFGGFVVIQPAWAIIIALTRATRPDDVFAMPLFPSLPAYRRTRATCNRGSRAGGVGGGESWWCGGGYWLM